MMIHLRNDTEVLSHRRDRCAMETHRTARSARQTGRPSTRARHPRCDLLSHAHRMRLADAAPRFPAVENGLRILRPMARRRHLGNDECAVARTGATKGGTTCRIANRGHRQPICENDRSRKRTRLRRGKKRSTAASGTCSLTRWVWSCLRRPGGGCARAGRGQVSARPGHFRFLPAEHHSRRRRVRRTIGGMSPKFGAAGSWRSSVELPGASWCSSIAGLWSERSRGFTTALDSPRITNTCRSRANPIFTSP